MKKKRTEKNWRNLKNLRILEKTNLLKKAGSFLRIVISILLGFLPSFLFIVLFVQYGSPFENYLNFLLTPAKSWIAWVSAAVIAFLFNLIRKLVKSRKKISERIRKNKVVLVLLILCFAGLAALISVQLYLYVNFILKNDILVRLSADKENIFFTDNLSDQIDFKISVTMNPFCSANCRYSFFDISEGREIEGGSFNIDSISLRQKTYNLENKNLAAGSQTLYSFEVSCLTKKTLFCYTKGEESKRTILATVNYALSEENTIFKTNSKEEIVSFGKAVSYSEIRMNESEENIAEIGNAFSTGDFVNQSETLPILLKESGDLLSRMKELWEAQDFETLKKELPLSREKIHELENKSLTLSSGIKLDISLYNSLAEKINLAGNIILEISEKNMSHFLCIEVNNSIADFNEVRTNFTIEQGLPEKKVLAEKIFQKAQVLYSAYTQDSKDFPCPLNNKISEQKLELLDTISLNLSFQEIYLDEPVPQCCFLGECGKCCDERCSKSNYPVIFLHGYSMNKALPADYSLTFFRKLKDKLEEDGYIDAGAVIISPYEEQAGLWGKIEAPVTLTASYFFDTYKIGAGENTIQSKTDNIDTYSIRLKNIIDLVKYRTGKDKVIIIAHSMGGLVARRYVQLFGKDDISKAIFLTIPNHGIEDKVRDYCALLGPELACKDMDKDGLFINKLDNSPTDFAEIYNIIGIGCNMGSETGDGIVKNSSQYLDYANNYYVEGKCNELTFDFFHESILDPDEYPEVYGIIRKIIR